MTRPHRRQIVRRVEHVMGMPVSLALAGRHADSGRGHAAWDAVMSSLRDADATFSTYRTDSWVRRLDRDEVTVVECPAEVGEVLALGARARRESGGAFDVHLPGPGGSTVLDPSGVVKGWAVDRAARFLDLLEDTDYCLSAGGDMVCRTRQPDAPDWRVGIEDPRDPQRVVAVLPLRNGAVATSGSAHRGAHLVDPRTGKFPRAWASVTVVAADLVTADVDATAAFVLGEHAPDWLRGRDGRAAVLVDQDAVVTTLGFAGGTD